MVPTFPFRDDADGLVMGGDVADGLEDDLQAVPAGEVTNDGDAFVAAGGDHVGGTAFEGEVGVRPVG